MVDYTDDYRLLGISPGCSLQALKAARRRLIKSWHPDHFPAGGDEKKSAEERIKRINAAFDRLVDYHHRHGALPTATETTIQTPSPADSHAATSSPRDARSSRFRETTTEPSASNREPAGRLQPIRPRNPIPWLIAFIALAFLSESIFTDLGWFDRPNAEISDRILDTADNQNHAQDSPIPINSTTSKKHFTIGSGIDDVYRIQGAPTKAESGVWYYGKSRVYFANGVVTSWDNNPEDPLHVALSPEIETDARVFTVGSTKDEVRAIQGTPLVETEELWDYGLSKVYFRANHVIGWDSSPIKPLRARK